MQWDSPRGATRASGPSNATPARGSGTQSTYAHQVILLILGQSVAIAAAKVTHPPNARQKVVEKRSPRGRREMVANILVKADTSREATSSMGAGKVVQWAVSNNHNPSLRSRGCEKLNNNSNSSNRSRVGSSMVTVVLGRVMDGEIVRHLRSRSAVWHLANARRHHGDSRSAGLFPRRR